MWAVTRPERRRTRLCCVPMPGLTSHDPTTTRTHTYLHLRLSCGCGQQGVAHAVSQRVRVEVRGAGTARVPPHAERLAVPISVLQHHVYQELRPSGIALLRGCQREQHCAEEEETQQPLCWGPPAQHQPA